MKFSNILLVHKQDISFYLNKTYTDKLFNSMDTTCFVMINQLSNIEPLQFQFFFSLHTF